MADGGGVLLRSPRDTKLRSKPRVLRDPTSDLHPQATSSRKGRRTLNETARLTLAP
jgi:hypothetical protein